MGCCLPVAGDLLKRAVVSAQRDVEPNHGLAGIDQIEVLLLDASQPGCFIVEEFDLLEETRFVVFVELWAKSRHFWGLSGKSPCRCRK